MKKLYKISEASDGEWYVEAEDVLQAICKFSLKVEKRLATIEFDSANIDSAVFQLYIKYRSNVIETTASYNIVSINLLDI
jgi:hypothetical protein